MKGIAVLQRCITVNKLNVCSKINHKPCNKIENERKNDNEREPSPLANYENIHVWGKTSSQLCPEKQSQIGHHIINENNELVTKQKMKYVPNNTSEYYSKFRNGDEEFMEQAIMSNDKKRRNDTYPSR